MKNHEKILQMIETVDPSDAAALDEIDARVWCWLNNYEFLYMEQMNVMRIDFHAKSIENGYGYRNPTHDVPLCTRSRDALKEIRPEGWVFSMQSYLPSMDFKFLAINLTDNNADRFTPFVPTEELAELHAIIQAIAFEREQGEK